MSPPKVNLAGKEPLKPSSDEFMSEKGDGVEFPAVITVETERRARQVRRLKVQQKYRRIIVGIIVVIVMAIAALSTMFVVFRLRHHRRQGWKCGVTNEDVTVDPDRQLIYAKVDHDNDKKTNALHILHEYGRGMVAYKDLDNAVCYIDRLDETFEDGYERWEGYEVEGRQDHKYLKVISKPIEVEVLKHIGDIHIYAHCENSESVWVMEIEETEVTEEMRVVEV